jgi:magnesium transporter
MCWKYFAVSGAPGGPGALVAILEVIVDHAADVLEGVGRDLDCLSRKFWHEPRHPRRHKPREDGEQLRLVLRKSDATAI